MADIIVKVTDQYIMEVTSAPDEALIALSMLQVADHRGLRIGTDTIWIGTGPGSVEYQVTGWDDEVKALKVRKVDA